MRNCKVSDTSTEGIYVIASSDVLLERNIFTRNNIEEIYGYYPAAVREALPAIVLDGTRLPVRMLISVKDMYLSITC
jgi:parallel beta-helix repeat protein